MQITNYSTGEMLETTEYAIHSTWEIIGTTQSLITLSEEYLKSF